MQIHDQPQLKAEARNFNFFYGEAQALKKINMPIYDKKVTALIKLQVPAGKATPAPPSVAFRSAS